MCTITDGTHIQIIMLKAHLAREMGKIHTHSYVFFSSISLELRPSQQHRTHATEMLERQTES
jgi:hypothetical protein